MHACIHTHTHTHMYTQLVVEMSGRLSVEQQIILYMIAMVVGLMLICPCIKPFILMADRRLHASREVRVCACVCVCARVHSFRCFRMDAFMFIVCTNLLYV
jgi:hypothetical protein